MGSGKSTLLKKRFKANASIGNYIRCFDVSGEFEVADIKKAAYKEVFFTDDNIADKWYKAKLQFITIDEKTEKEKRSTVNYLVQAGSMNGAMKNIDEVMGGTMIDYVVASVAETTLMDVYEYGKKNDKPEYEQQ